MANERLAPDSGEAPHKRKKKKEKKLSDDKVKKPKKEKETKLPSLAKEKKLLSDENVRELLSDDKVKKPNKKEKLSDDKVEKPKKEKKLSDDKVKKPKKEKRDKRDKKEKRDREVRQEKELSENAEQQLLAEALQAEAANGHIAAASSASSLLEPHEGQDPDAMDGEGEAATKSQTRDKPTIKEGKSKKKTEKRDMASNGSDPLFIIDVKPTKVNVETLAADAVRIEPSDDEGDDAVAVKTYSRGQQLPPSGMNRAVRRRLKLIDRQKEAIQKKLGAPVGSTEPNDEVDRELAEWTARMDEKAENRAAKKKERKKKEEMRLRNRKGRLLKGKVLREKTQSLRKAERKAAKQVKTSGVA